MRERNFGKFVHRIILNCYSPFVQSINLPKFIPVLALALLLGSARADEMATNNLLSSQTLPFDAKIEPMRLHTTGNQVLDASGKPVWLYGVNIASLEWRNDGDHVQESVSRAINDWKVDLIRLPLAQDRWFGKMTNQMDGGAAYRAIVDNIVSTCAAARVYIDLDLHWSDCGKWVNEGGQLGQHNLPDANSITFWQDMATRFKNHPNVIFGLYNEPHDASFAVWRNGGKIKDKPAQQRNITQTRIAYKAVGMQKLYDTVRATGATNVVTVAGLDWGYDLSGVLHGHAIAGTNFVYETHPYPFKDTNWDANFGAVSEKYPVYVGEWGFGGGRHMNNITNNLVYAHDLMDYIHQHHLSWTAWDFHVAAGPTLIKNWDYEPTVFGQIVKDQLAMARARNSNN
jgi:endoglucanase